MYVIVNKEGRKKKERRVVCVKLRNANELSKGEEEGGGGGEEGP